VKDNSTAQLQRGEIQDLDLNKMQNIIRTMPQYSELLARYSLHMFLAQKVLGVFNSANLKSIGDLEQTIATGVDSSGDLPSSSDIFAQAIKVLSDPALPSNLKLRLAVLLNTSIDLNDRNLNSVKNSMNENSDVKTLDNLTFLGVRNDSSRGATKSKVPEELKKAYKKFGDDSKYDLTRFVPRLQFLLEQVYQDKIDKSRFSSVFYPLSGQTKSALPSNLGAFQTNNLSKASPASREKLIVFFVGGIAYPEVRVAKQLAVSTNKNDVLVISGGTTCLSPGEFLDELAGLGFSRTAR